MSTIIPKPFVPLPYQPEMLQHLHGNPKALLLVEMGLGKTVVILKLIEELVLDGAITGCLIVAPLRVKLLTWPEQAAAWQHSSWMRVVDMSTPEGEEAWNNGAAHIYLAHYDTLSTREVTRKHGTCKGLGCPGCDAGFTTAKYPGFVARFLKGRRKLPAQMLVYDEISVFKAHNGKRAATMRAYHDKFDRIIGMTGTPLGNSRLNLFNIVRMVDGGERFGPSFTKFRDRYAESDFMGYKWKMREGACAEIDEKISDISLVLLAEDHANLPPLFIEDIEVPLPAAAESAYLRMEKELLLELEKGDIVSLNAAVLAGKLLQILGGACFGENREVHQIHDAKIKALQKLRKKLGPKEPILVLTAYTHEIPRILEAIPGARKFDLKDIDLWRAGKIPMWCADARSLSHGIDSLQVSCCTQAWFTPHWSSETVQQTIKRIHRRGNDRDTTVYRLIGKLSKKTSMDEVVIESNREMAGEQAGMLAALKRLQRLRKKEVAK